ncbi:MAG: DNA repair protein RadA [Endomicrobiia bacterium]
MKKNIKETHFVCKECGYESLKWLGRCPECGSWNSFTEFRMNNTLKSITSFSSEAVKLSEINLLDKQIKFSTGISELDRILGGGLVNGSIVLIGGEPGVGKSTLMLQIADNIANLKKFNDKNYKVLYVTAEESIEQLKIRAERLKINNPAIYILSETSLENILKVVDEISPDVLIIDSIQTVYSENIPNIQGSIPQIRGITSEIIRLAKFKGITVFILGHITKEGDIAGPKLLEHMVDTVLYFETETTQNYRILRVYKNRFGPSSEIGIFEMTSSGLKEVVNPSEFFVNHNKNFSGTVTTCIVEGTRPLLTQIQALITKSYFSQPRRVVAGIDYNRTMLLLSVLEKFAGINLVYEDVYISVVAGLKIKETAVDLALVVAVYSSFKNIPVDSKNVYIGEIGLNGEIRAVSFVNERLNEISKLGYKKLILPFENKKNISLSSQSIDIQFISSIFDIDKVL